MAKCFPSDSFQQVAQEAFEIAVDLMGCVVWNTCQYS